MLRLLFATLFSSVLIGCASFADFEEVISRPSDYTITPKQNINEMRPCLKTWLQPFANIASMRDWERGIYIVNMSTRLVVEQTPDSLNLYFNDWLLFRDKAKRAVDECNNNPKSYPDAEFRSAF